MNLNLHWMNLLILFGAVQALIFTIILLFNKRHPGARFLAAFVFVFAYNGFETFNWSSGLDQHFLFFDMFGFIVIYAVGPAFYFYVRSVLQPDQQINRKLIWLHFSPFIFHLSTRIAIIIYHLLWINGIIQSKITSMSLMRVVWLYAEPLSVLLFLGYLVAAIIYFKKSRPSNTTKLIPKDSWQIASGWIRTLLVMASIFAAIWVLTVAAPYLVNVPIDSHYYPIEIGLVFFVYWLALAGFHKTRLIQVKVPPPVSLLKTSQYATQFDLLQNKIETEQLYLDPEFNVAKLAAKTGLPVKTISAILNQYKNTSFNDFVNGYRVNAVKTMLLDEANSNLTISGIAYDAGFNSQATFQRAFKKYTGQSPSEFLNGRLKKPA